MSLNKIDFFSNLKNWFRVDQIKWNSITKKFLSLQLVCKKRVTLNLNQFYLNYQRLKINIGSLVLNSINFQTRKPKNNKLIVDNYLNLRKQQKKHKNRRINSSTSRRFSISIAIISFLKYRILIKKIKKPEGVE